MRPSLAFVALGIGLAASPVAAQPPRTHASPVDVQEPDPGGLPVAPVAEQGRLTLAEAQAIALQNHPRIRSSSFAAEAAGQTVDEARSQYFPQVYGSAIRAFADRGTRIAAPPSGLTDPTVLDRGSAGISFTQLITDFGRTDDLVMSARRAFEANEDRVESAKLSVLFAATKAYFDVLRANALLRVAQDTLKSRRVLVDQVSSLRNAKIKSDLDVSIARQTLDRADLLLVRAQNNVEDAWQAFAEALGSRTPRRYRLADDQTALAPPGSRDSVIAEALASNPDLKALIALKDSADYQADADREARLPTISADGFAGVSPIRNQDQPISQNYAVGGVRINVPLFTGGQLSARQHRSEFRAKSLGADVETATNELARNVGTAWDNVQTAYRNIAVTQQLVRSSTDAFDLTRARYDIGSSSIVDLTQAELAQTEAVIEHYNAVYDYKTLVAALDYLRGQGGPAGGP